MTEKLKIFGICGSARHASTEWAVKLSLETAESLGYVETEFVNLGDYNLVPCTGCMRCFGWMHPADAERPKCYEAEDDSEALLTKMMESDGIIMGTPVYTLGVTSLARIFMEKAHMFGPMSFTKFSGMMRYKPCGVITVGGVDIAGQEVCAQDIWMWALGLGMTTPGSWPTRDDPNPMASVHAGIVSTCDGRQIYGKSALSKEACRTVPPTQGWRNEKSIRNVGRHVAIAAMLFKLGKKAFEEGGYKAPEIIPFTRYSVKPKKGSWVQKLIDDGRVTYVDKGDNEPSG
ncbi:MAG: flavodoxin family protein [Thermodesulfobacteriota bacterium]|nr:flavodoxin family protein [Thermodesulfobacteriota bacterium]